MRCLSVAWAVLALRAALNLPACLADESLGAEPNANPQDGTPISPSPPAPGVPPVGQPQNAGLTSPSPSAPGIPPVAVRSVHIPAGGLGQPQNAGLTSPSPSAPGIPPVGLYPSLKAFHIPAGGIGQPQNAGLTSPSPSAPGIPPVAVKTVHIPAGGLEQPQNAGLTSPSPSAPGIPPVGLQTFKIPADGSVDMQLFRGSPLLTGTSSFLSPEDAELVRSVNADTMESYIAALQDPASHCQSSELFNTHFCITLREYAAAVLAARQLEGAECVTKSLKEIKKEKQEIDRAMKVQAKQAAKVEKAERAKKKPGLKFGLFSKKKSASKASNKDSVTAVSMVELPTLKGQAIRKQTIYREYADNLQTATQDVGNSPGGNNNELTMQTMQVFDGSLYIQAGTLLLIGMAKEVLNGVMAAATAVPAGSSVELDPGDVEGTLRSVLVQGSSYAQPLAPFCVHIIQSSLESVNTKEATVEEATAAAFVALSSLDSLVCATAKIKARMTAEYLGTPADEINSRVQPIFGNKEYAGLSRDMAEQVVKVVLSIIDDPNGVTVVQYTKSSQVKPALQHKPTPAPRTKRPLPADARAVDSSSVVVPGLDGKAMGLTTLPFFETVGQVPPFGARFHGAQVDYALGSVGTQQDICVTESMVLPDTTLVFPSGEGPSQSLGALAASAVERWALRKAHEAVKETVTLFRNNESILAYIKNLLDRHIAKLKEANSPAPSFNSLTSSSCKSYSDDARRLFYEMFFNGQIFSLVKQDPDADSRLRLRAQILQEQGIIPAMSLKADQMLAKSMRDIQNTIHNETGRGKKAGKYGFLDVCDSKCYKKAKSKRGDIMGSVVYSLDHTLTKLNSMAYRAFTLGATFFGGFFMPLNSDGRHVKGSHQEALLAVLRLWDIHIKKGKKVMKKEPLPDGIALTIEDYVRGLERYGNMILESPHTRGLYNLAAHTWIQIRGIHNAAEGYLPKTNSRISQRNRQIAAIFAKLWFEADIALGGREHSVLKPFPAMMASVALQVAFFLHSVLGEYKASVWKRMGSAVKSFFVGMFKKNKRMSIPSSWAQIQARAQSRQQRTNVRNFQGALHTIRDLAKMFHARFLKLAIESREYSSLLPSYIAFIHALVAQWMIPHGEKLSLSDPRIPTAKKLFYYSVFVHPDGLTSVAAEIIKKSCADMKKIDTGKVKATVESTGKRQAIGVTILKQNSIHLKQATLEYQLNMLLPTYDDPFDILRVAQDLATRCQAESTASESNEAAPPPPQPEEAKPENTEEGKPEKRFKFPKLKFKKPKKADPNSDALVQVLSSKFVLDLWCLKYRDYVMKLLTEVPKTTDGDQLFSLFEEILNKTTEIVITPKTADASWVLNLKCPFMQDFVDANLRQAARKGMVQYAISRRGLGKRIRRKLRAIGNWFTKKFTWKRKNKPGLVANNEWAVIHVGTGVWDSSRKRYEHTLTFRPESMACGSLQGPKKLKDFQNGQFIDSVSTGAPEENSILCVKDGNYCWATTRALMFKGSTEPPLRHFETPAGMWYSRLPAASPTTTLLPPTAGTL